MPDLEKSGLRRITDHVVDVASEIIDVLLATGKHEIIVLSRSVSLSHLLHTMRIHASEVDHSHRPSQSASLLPGLLSSQSTITSILSWFMR